VYNVVASEASCDSESSYGAKSLSTVKVLLLQAGTIANDDDLDHKLFEEMPERQPQAGEPCHNLSFLFLHR
jgi:hypothetical protein